MRSVMEGSGIPVYQALRLVTRAPHSPADRRTDGPDGQVQALTLGEQASGGVIRGTVIVALSSRWGNRLALCLASHALPSALTQIMNSLEGCRENIDSNGARKRGQEEITTHMQCELDEIFEVLGQP